MGYFVACHLGKLRVWENVLGIWTTDALAGGLPARRVCSKDDQAMTELREKEIRAIVADMLAEQRGLYCDEIDALVLSTIATILAPFGIEEEDRREIRADFEHLRCWRKSVEQAQSYTFKTVINVIVVGFVGAICLGVKVMLGK
jgi:hypothetical protein